MSPERGDFHPLAERIEQEVGSLDAEAKAELQGSPETSAEELFALWEDYGRLLGEQRDFRKNEQDQTAQLPKEKRDAMEHLRLAIAQRWHKPEAQTALMEKLRQWNEERMKLAEPLADFRKLQDTRDSYLAEQEQLYRGVFQHREHDPDELTQIRLGELAIEIDGYDQLLDVKERETPEFAARLSFERIVEYNQQLRTEEFIWTPSREAYFRRIVDHLVIVNQNRPLLLSGGTGTGKTELARAVSRRLTISEDDPNGRNPFEVGEEAKTDIRPLLGSKAIDKQESYIQYGQLGQALTGKETSRDKESGPGGIFYMDEMNGYPPDALRSLIKQISGRRPGVEMSFAAWYGQKERLTPEFGFLGSANLPSEKHPDRSDLPVEVARELGEIEIDYPPQTAANPELYEMMLAGLMDQNGRIRLSSEELAPEYEDVADTGIGVKHKKLKTEPKAGGTLWRFANLVAEVQRSYKGEDNTLTSTERDASYLRAAVLDPGLVLAWLGAYRKSAQRQGIDLQSFLGEKLQAWSGKKIYPKEDRKLLGKFFSEYNLEVPDDSPDVPAMRGIGIPTSARRNVGTMRVGHEALTPQEIGALSPRVPRETELLKEAPRPVESSAILDDGSEALYSPDEQRSGRSFTKKGDTSRTKQGFTFLGHGKGAHEGKVIVQGRRGNTIVMDQRDFLENYETSSLVFSERFEGREIKIDVAEELRLSKEFYHGHDLRELEANLPPEVRFSTAGEGRIREAIKMGFDQAMILPASEVQGRSLNAIIEQLATKPHTGLSAAEQYNDPYVDESAKQAQTRNRPPKAYMLMYQSKEVPPETKGKSPDELEALFQQEKWNGMTVSEYLLLQRKELEKRKNHSFDAYNDDASKSQWTWLMDSRVSGVADARWSPGGRRVSVRWGDAGGSGPGLGARPAVVVEIL